MSKPARVLGLCGCEGAGKTTIAEMLVAGPKTNSNANSKTKQTPKTKHVWTIPSPKTTVVQRLFGIDIRGQDVNLDTARDPIWNMTGSECVELIERLMQTHVDPNWNWAWCANALSWSELKRNPESAWVEIAFADPLKYVAALLFNVNYNMLLGKTPNARSRRLEIVTPEYQICGALTGRQILEYFGTDIMRRHFDDQIWVKIAMRDIEHQRQLGKNVVVQDVRFVNEKNAIAQLGGELLVIFRDPADLEITQADHASHPAKWQFKTFIDSTDLPIRMLHNSDDLSVLHWRLSELTV